MLYLPLCLPHHTPKNTHATATQFQAVETICERQASKYLTWLHLLGTWQCKLTKIGHFVDRRRKYCYWQWHERGWKLGIKTTISGSPSSLPTTLSWSLTERLFSEEPVSASGGFIFMPIFPLAVTNIHLVIGPLMSSGRTNWGENCKHKDSSAKGLLDC